MGFLHPFQGTDSSEMQEALSLKDHWGQLLEAVSKRTYQENSNIVIVEYSGIGSSTHTDSRIDERKD